MARKLPVVLLAALLCVACSTAQPPAPPVVTVPDPHTDPTIVNGIYDGARVAEEAAERGATTGRRVGTVVGLLAAVLGGSGSESIGEAIDRYRRTRDTIELAGAVIGMTRGAAQGGKRGYELDVQFAELHRIDGVEVMRPMPDEIIVRFASMPSQAQLEEIAAVFIGHEPNVIEITAAGEQALDIRNVLIDAGLSSACVNARRDNTVSGAVLRIRSRD